MFDFLKGGKVYITLKLDQPNKFFRFGDPVRGTLTVENEKELKIQEGRVALVFKEESQYRYESTDRDSDGHERRTTNTSWQNDERVVAQNVFLREGVLAAKSSKSYEFDFAIPQNAAPTIEGGQIVRAKWLVKATLDRKMASDYNEQVEIPVFELAQRYDGSDRNYGYSNEPGEAEMALHLPMSEWAMGETIEGELIIKPQKSFDATEVRVELARTESVPRDLGNQYVDRPAIKLAGGTKFEPGQALTLPFRLTIPVRPPSAQTEKFRVEWQIAGVLARRLRGDTRVEETIRVCNARAE
ncbi:MAG: hypothetical protein HZC40_19635 [Chloroflexi bacterium]|nr:hypothetical protein [Chloroflexota bacterium]